MATVQISLLLLLSAILLSQGQNIRVLFQCDFENNENQICGMTQETSDKTNWVRKSGGTPSGDTGPTKADDGSFYIYIEASPLKDNDNAIISTTLAYRGDACVRFKYHMYGQHMGKLEVKTGSGDTFSVSGQQQTSNAAAWKDGQVDVKFTDSNAKVTFEGTRGTGVFSDVSLDAIRVIAGTCDNPLTVPPATQSTAATTTTTVRPPDPVTGSSCPNSNAISFETGRVTECASSQATDDRLDWVVTNKATASEETGPANAAAGSFYIHVEASGTRNGDSARLILRRPSISGTVCVRIAFHMYGYHTGSLEFYTLSNNVRTPVLQLKGEQQTKADLAWRDAELDIDNNAIDGLGLIATVGDGIHSDIAVDNIRYTSGSCFSPKSGDIFSCDFERTLCGMTQDTSDQMDWRMLSGPTKSLFTGPTAAASGSYYIYIEATGQNNGDTAILYTKTFSAGDYCVTLRYNMYGFHIGKIEVIILQTDGKTRSAWSVSKQQDTQSNWRTKSVTVNLKSGEKVGFLGQRGGGYSGDAAIDDVRMKTGAC